VSVLVYKFACGLVIKDSFLQEKIIIDKKKKRNKYFREVMYQKYVLLFNGWTMPGRQEG
jgi:hypothetical protein